MNQTTIIPLHAKSASTNTQPVPTHAAPPLTFSPPILKLHAPQGWHLEMDNPDDDLTFKGVVFNEMKGVYSSPDSMFYRWGWTAIFPARLMPPFCLQPRRSADQPTN